MAHTLITIQADEAQQEILLSKLATYDCEGFEQKENELLAYIIEGSIDAVEIKKILKGFSFTEEIVIEKNWNEEWEKNFEPVNVGDFCSIRAPFHQDYKSATHELIIMPKMSFGTGHHATTYMMIEQMSKLDFRGKTVLDFGTGTGVLAILAEKLGASSILAMDNDEWSIRNAKENVGENACGKIELLFADQLPGRMFDIILANINRHVILSQASDLKLSSKPGGHIIVSGILEADEKGVQNALESSGFRLAGSASRSGWMALMFVNEP